MGKEWIMRTSLILGVVLIVFGVLALAYGSFSYTREKEVLDLGPIEATAETRETIPLPPILGGAAIVGGIALVVAGSRRRV
jgi:uncharacterized membrane protein YidH (DUF202 family)